MHSNTSQSPSYGYPSSLARFAVAPSQLSTAARPIVVVGACIFAPRGEPSSSLSSPPRMLLLRRAATDSFPNVWEVPGGGAEPADATVLDAVAREVLEESALVVTDVVELLGTQEFTSSSGAGCTKYNFLVETAPGPVATHPAEHSEWKWFRAEEIEALLVANEDVRNLLAAAFARVRELRGGATEPDVACAGGASDLR